MEVKRGEGRIRIDGLPILMNESRGLLVFSRTDGIHLWLMNGGFDNRMPLLSRASGFTD